MKKGPKFRCGERLLFSVKGNYKSNERVCRRTIHVCVSLKSAVLELSRSKIESSQKSKIVAEIHLTNGLLQERFYFDKKRDDKLDLMPCV